MEDGLRDLVEFLKKVDSGKCLNPCFNGRWSARDRKYLKAKGVRDCLNPCFNGRWSASRFV